MADEPKVRIQRLMQTLDRRPDLHLLIRNDRVDVFDVNTREMTPIWLDKLWGEDDRSLLQRLKVVITNMEDEGR